MNTKEYNEFMAIAREESEIPHDLNVELCLAERRVQETIEHAYWKTRAEFSQRAADLHDKFRTVSFDDYPSFRLPTAENFIKMIELVPGVQWVHYVSPSGLLVKFEVCLFFEIENDMLYLEAMQDINRLIERQRPIGTLIEVVYYSPSKEWKAYHIDITDLIEKYQ